MDSTREFNPNALQLVSDRDVDDEDVINVDSAQPTWPGIPASLHHELTHVKRLDGLMIASESMKIGKNCGVLQFFQFPCVVDRHLNRFKGLKDFFGSNTKHLYEFNLCGLGAGVTLCAVVTTKETVHKFERPKFAVMVKEYHNCIRKCISKLPPSAMTRQLNLTAPNVPLQVYKDDWADLCENLRAELCDSASHLVGQNVFPKSPKFYWTAKLLGQNLTYDENRKEEILGAYKFAVDLDTGHRFAVSIHCAIDTELKDNLLFWNPNVVAKSYGNVKPAVLYHVALLPGLANMTYADVKRSQFSYVQYYSRLFSGCHRDNSNVFLYNCVARSLFDRYCRKLGNMKHVKPSQRDLFIDDIAGKLTSLFDGIKECCNLTNPARLEAVWTMQEDFDVTNGIVDVIGAAFQDFNLAANDQVNPFFSPTMIVNFTTSSFASRVVPWIDIIQSTISDLSDSVQLVEREENLWNMKAPLIIPVKKFACAQLAEFLLHLIIKGKRHKSYSSDWENYLGLTAEFLAEYQNFDLLCGVWPFSNTLVDSKNCIEAEYPEELESLIPGLKLTNNRFLSFAEKRKEFGELPDAYRNSRNFRQIFDELANHLLDLILYIQKSKTSSSNWGEITLQMLILEKIDFSRKVRHYNTDDFIQLLAYPEILGKRMPMFQETRELKDVFDALKTDLNRFAGFRSVLRSKLEDKIKDENCPLRFSYGKLHEVYVHFTLDVFPPSEDSLKTLDRALVDANKNRTTNCTISLRDLVSSSKQFLDRNNFANMSEVAAAVQDVFDLQRIKTTRKIPNDFKNLLENLAGISSANLHDDNMSESEEDEDFDVNEATNPLPDHLPGPLPGTSSQHNIQHPNQASGSAVAKKKWPNSGGKSKRSLTTSKSMFAYWAKRRANQPK